MNSLAVSFVSFDMIARTATRSRACSVSFSFSFERIALLSQGLKKLTPSNPESSSEQAAKMSQNRVIMPNC